MTRGTPEHAKWVRSWVDSARSRGHVTRDAVLAWAREYGTEQGCAYPARGDLDALGSWAKVTAQSYDVPPPVTTTPPPAIEPVDSSDARHLVNASASEVPAIDVDVSELEAVSTEPMADVVVTAPTPRELLDLQRSRAEVADLKRRLAETLEALHHADERAGVVGHLRAAPDPTPIARRERASGLREATAVVLASDWHVEELIDPATVEGRNAYSLDVARARAQRMTDGTLWLLDMHREKFALRDLVLWLGGDLISGYLHEELEETNALSPIEATLFAHELVGGMIASLLERGDLERLVVPCNVGNHGRTTRRTRAKTRVQNSYEFLLYRNLQQRFAADPRVEFTIAGGSHLYLDVYEQTIRFHHGDDVKYGGGIGGVTVPLNKAIASWQSFHHADLTCIGHFHQLLHGRDFVVNGSLVGYSEFALSIKAQFEPPQQAFFLMDSKRGRCCATPLWVDDGGEP